VRLSRTAREETRGTELSHANTHGYHVGAPEMGELLEWCPKDGKEIFTGTLPWASRFSEGRITAPGSYGEIRVGTIRAQIAQVKTKREGSWSTSGSHIRGING